MSVELRAALISLTPWHRCPTGRSIAIFLRRDLSQNIREEQAERCRNGSASRFPNFGVRRAANGATTKLADVRAGWEEKKTLRGREDGMQVARTLLIPPDWGITPC